MIIRFQGKSRTWCVFQIDWWFFSFQVTIVIKYFFQFGFFPFHSSVDKNKPLHPPNIIGVEKKDGYVHYDLVQLLALFFHRSILKVWANTKIYRRLPHMKTKTIKNYRRILFFRVDSPEVHSLYVSFYSWHHWLDISSWTNFHRERKYISNICRQNKIPLHILWTDLCIWEANINKYQLLAAQAGWYTKLNEKPVFEQFRCPCWIVLHSFPLLSTNETKPV